MKSLGATAATFILLLPLAAVAHEDLRAHIRADLMADPRSAQLSSSEIDALVEALATEAEANGSTDAFLSTQDSFDYSAEFAAAASEGEASAAVNMPLILAVAALGVVLIGVALYVLRRKGDGEPPSDIGA